MHESSYGSKPVLGTRAQKTSEPENQVDFCNSQQRAHWPECQMIKCLARKKLMVIKYICDSEDINCKQEIVI